MAIQPSKPIRTGEERVSADKVVRERPLFGVRQTKMEVQHSIPGYTLCYITDYADGRLAYAMECGYEFVTRRELGLRNTQTQIARDEDMSDRISLHAGTSDVLGQTLRTYLMKIPNEYYAASQAAIAEMSERQVNAIYAGEQSQVEKKYIPKSIGTKITTS